MHPGSIRRFRRSIFALCLLSSVVVVWLADGIATGQSPAKTQRVTIDIKPGDTPTIIQPKREGMLPVAILSMLGFEANSVDPATVRIGATGTEASVFRSASEDVDKDGDTDLMLLFRMKELKLECTDKAIRLSGETTSGQRIEGEETVTMEGCG